MGARRRPAAKSKEEWRPGVVGRRVQRSFGTTYASLEGCGRHFSGIQCDEARVGFAVAVCGFPIPPNAAANLLQRCGCRGAARSAGLRAPEALPRHAG